MCISFTRTAEALHAETAAVSPNVQNLEIFEKKILLVRPLSRLPCINCKVSSSLHSIVLGDGFTRALFARDGCLFASLDPRAHPPAMLTEARDPHNLRILTNQQIE